MPQLIDVPGLGRVEFPDGMPDEEIQDVLGRELKMRAAAHKTETGRKTAKRERAKAAVYEGLGEMQKGLRRPIETIGTGLKRTGDLAAGVALDVAEDWSRGRLPTPGENTAAAIGGDPLPGEEGLPPVKQGLVDAVRTLPAVAGGVMLQMGGVPAPLAFGAPMAGQAAGVTGDTVETIAAGAAGAMIPGFGQLARQAGAKALGAAVERGLLSGHAATAHKAAEVLASQGGIQAMMETLNLPAYLQMEPGERKDAIIRSLAANTAFMALDVPHVVRGGPSATQAGLSPDAKVGLLVEQLVRDPVAIDALQARIDETALRLADPRGAGSSAADGSRPPAPEQIYRLGDDPGAESIPIETPPVAPEAAPARPEAPRQPQAPPETTLVDVPVQPIPKEAIAVRPDLMQFKRMDDSDAGVNKEDEISGKWDDLKAGNLLLWEPADPAAHGLKEGEKYIVANGHHRFNFGKDQVKGFNAQVVREADGYSAADARALGAEINIADGKGTIYDQARFIRNEAAVRGADGAVERARRIGAKGRKAATVALAAENSLYDAFINEQITPDQAEVIARTAPQAEALQRVGIQQARRGKSGQDLANFILAVKASAGPQAEQVDLFGADDTALAAAERMAAQASKVQKEISEQIAAVQGAARRPEQAAKLGVDVRDPDGILKRIEELKYQRQRWDNWHLDPELVARVKGEPAPAPEPPPTAPLADQGPQLRSMENQGDLLAQQQEPFNLAVEKSVDGERIAREKAEAESAAREALAAQEKQQRPLFSMEPAATSASGFASAGGYQAGTPVLTGSIQHVRPLEMPELVRLARELMNNVPFLKKLPKARGVFHPVGEGAIALRPDLFKDPAQAAKTLAHELGHLIDYLPDKLMKRGNLWGRLASLRQHLKERFGQSSVTNSALRKELIDLSAFWRPWNRAQASKTEIRYRDSAVELYADAISVLFNSPGLLEQRAPEFYNEFFAFLDRKPTVKQEFFDLQALLQQGPEAVANARMQATREGFEKAEVMLKEKFAERQSARDSWDGFWLKVKQQNVDVGSAISAKLAEVRKKGVSVPKWADPRYAFEEQFFADNRTMLDLREIHTKVVKRVEDAGMDLHTLGLVLKYQREIGNLKAYLDLQTMRRDLGPRFELLEKAALVLRKGRKRSSTAYQALESRVDEALKQHGLSVSDVHQMEGLKLTQGSRADLANPGGMAPATAEDTLNALRASLGPAKTAVLENAAAEFRAIVFKRVTEGKEAGIYSQEMYDTVILSNRDSYAAFRGLEHVDTYVSPMARKAFGTLGDVENPFYTTLLKLASLNNLIMVQRGKLATRDFFQQYFPESFRPAPLRWDGVRNVPKKPEDGLARMEILENGRIVHYDVDPYVAQAFDRFTPGDVSWVTKLLDIPFRKVLYPIIIRYNPGFQFYSNPIRDFARSSRNIGAIAGIGPVEFVRRYMEVWGSARKYVRGEPDPIGREMLEAHAIGLPMDSFAHLDRQDGLSQIMKRYRLMPTADRSKLVDLLMWLPRKIEHAGAVVEALPKFATYKSLVKGRGWDAREAAMVVRNYVGTPNFRVKGQHGNVANVIVPFSNIFIQGYRADRRVAFAPTTRGGWWFRWFVQDGTVSMLQGLAAAGVFGAVLKGLFDGVSEHDKSNYTVIPLGYQTGGEFGFKTVYIRIPRDEVSRFLSAATYKLTRLIAGDHQGKPSDVFNLGADIVPTVNTFVEIGQAWNDYLRGINPVDPWRNRPVVPATEFKAGGMESLKPMLRYTLDKAGALNFVRYNEHANTTTEMVVSALPAVNRAVKVSDYGYRELQMSAEREEERIRAIARLDYAPEVRKTLHDYHYLQQIKGSRTPEQEARYAALTLWHRSFSRFDEASWLAEQAGNKAVAKNLRSSFSDFNKRFHQAIDQNVASPQFVPAWAPPPAR